jgi:hypothetical protein
MLHKKLIIVTLLASGMLFLLAGCYKDTTVLVQQDVTKTVSFNGDLMPIFNKSCNMMGCHNAGGQVPNLSPGNALRSLNEEDMINVDDPENSEIMGWLTGKLKPAMPLGAATNPSNINGLMLAWIKQGAKNN